MSLKLRPGKTAFLFLCLFLHMFSFGQDQTIDSLKIALSKLPDSPEKVQNLLEISQNYVNASLEDAVYFANAAKDLSARIGDNEGLAKAYRVLGVYYKKWGKYRESLDAYTSSLEIYKQMKDLSGQSQVLNNFGSLY